MSRHVHAAAWVMFLAAACACGKKTPPEPTSTPLDAGAVTAPIDASTPKLGLEPLPTTSPELALGNLDVQIKSREEALKRSADDVGAARTRIELLLTRGEYTSQIKDYETADALSDDLVKKHPTSADAHMARAATLSMFHRFTNALAELDTAAKEGAPKDAVAKARATALMGQGKFDEADALGAWREEASLDSQGLASAAVLAAERGKLEDSERLFEAARTKLRDVSPFTVAWMDFHRGELLERQGDRKRAQLYLWEAHNTLPTFAHPALHLAPHVTIPKTFELLQPLTKTSDDPAIDAAMADAFRRADKKGEMAPLLEKAKARYEELLKAHPEAFSDHAAQFFLGPGHDVVRGLALAKQNAKNRNTEPALDLWISAAMVNNKADESCAAAHAAERLPYATPTFKATFTGILSTCKAPVRDH